MPEQVPSRHACGVCGALIADGEWPTHVTFHHQLEEHIKLCKELADLLACELEKEKADD